MKRNVLAFIFLLIGLSSSVPGISAQETSDPVLQALQLSDGVALDLDGQLLEEV